MDKLLYHQTLNTKKNMITFYPYDYNHWEFNSPHFHKNYEFLIAAKGTFDCFINNQKYTLKLNSFKSKIIKEMI